MKFKILLGVGLICLLMMTGCTNTAPELIIHERNITANVELNCTDFYWNGTNKEFKEANFSADLENCVASVTEIVDGSFRWEK